MVSIGAGLRLVVGVGFRVGLIGVKGMCRVRSSDKVSCRCRVRARVRCRFRFSEVEG